MKVRFNAETVAEAYLELLALRGIVIAQYPVEKKPKH